MPALQSVYMMAFTPEKVETNILMSLCQMAADRLAAKDKTFAQRMSMLTQDTRLTCSNQLFAINMHTPENMQLTLKDWLKNENQPSELRFGDNFFPYGMRDPKGRENYFLFYFDIQ
jgi:hypothetical protein